MSLSESRTRLGSDLEEKVEQFAHFNQNEEERREVGDEFLQNHVSYTADRYLDLGNIGLDADDDLRNVNISEHVDEEDIEALSRVGSPNQEVDPDFDTLNYDNLRAAGDEGDIVTHPRDPRIPVGRGDQAPKADFQRLVWESAEKAAEQMLDQTLEDHSQPTSQHASETKEQIVLGGDKSANAKHMSIVHQYLVDEEGVEHYEVAHKPDNSTTISEVDTDRAASAIMGLESGFGFRENVEDKAVDFHEQLGEELGMKTEGDFNDVPMFELLLKAGVPPREIHAPVGQNTVGEDREADMSGTKTTTMEFDYDKSMEEGTIVYSTDYQGDERFRTVDEVVQGDAHTTAAVNYDLALPVFAVGDRLWLNNPVRGADKYQGALDIQQAIEEVTDGEYDSHPFIDMGFPAIDLETGYPVSEEMAEEMEGTPHGDTFGPFTVDMLDGGTGEWDDDDMLYHRNASLMAQAVTPEFAEYFREEVVPEVYNEMGVDPENPEGLEVDEFMTKAYELGARAMVEGTHKNQDYQATKAA